MRYLDGKVVVVTGAGSGIGRALALELAGRGARLALQDVDEVGLAETVRQVGGAGVLGQRVDVTRPEDVARGAAEVLDRFGAADVLVNNAGIAHGGVPFWELPERDWDAVMAVNLGGVVHGTRVWLPHLLTRPEAAVVNISSLFGLIGVTRQSAYCTSKFAVRGFTETLRMELRERAPHVRTLVVHPGGVKTAIARNSLRSGQDPSVREAEIAAFEELLSRTTPAAAARTVVGALLAGRERVLVGPDARALGLLARALPRHYTSVLLAGLRRAERGAAGTQGVTAVTRVSA